MTGTTLISDDPDPEAILKVLRRVASGEAAGDGRDEVGGRRWSSGAMRSRGLRLDVTDGGGELQLRVCEAEGDLRLGLRRNGEYIFEHGDVSLAASDSSAGGKFVDEVARWLGVPLTAGAVTAPGAVTGEYVRLGVRRDADGRDWDLFKLFLASGDQYAEVFLRLSADRTAAALAEKWARYRGALVRLLDGAVGHGRAVADHAVLVLANAQVELTLPPDWIVEDGQGCVTITDPVDECALEISYMHLPPMPADAPSLSAQLGVALVSAGHVAEVHTSARDGVARAWADYGFESDDPHRGVLRPARGRWLLISNGSIQMFATYCYWVDDTGWAVPAWERVAGSIRLGDGVGLSGYGNGPLSWVRRSGNPDDGSELAADVER